VVVLGLVAVVLHLLLAMMMLKMTITDKIVAKEMHEVARVRPIVVVLTLGLLLGVTPGLLDLRTRHPVSMLFMELDCGQLLELVFLVHLKFIMRFVEVYLLMLTAFVMCIMVVLVFWDNMAFWMVLMQSLEILILRSCQLCHPSPSTRLPQSTSL